MRWVFEMTTHGGGEDNGLNRREVKFLH